jgi:hypothetical protein
LVFSLELAEDFAAYVLTRRTPLGTPPAHIDSYFAAVNRVYFAVGRRKPWADDKGPMYELRRSYEGASKQLGQALGAEHPRWRVPVSGRGLNFVLALRTASVVVEAASSGGHRALQEESDGSSSGGGVSGDSLTIAATVLVALVGYAARPRACIFFSGKCLVQPRFADQPFKQPMLLMFR